jgi:hypothetical protein
LDQQDEGKEGSAWLSEPASDELSN